MSDESHVEPLRPVLHHVEEELSAHLATACGKNVREETTEELERLSDTLYEAAREARAAAALRRRIRAVAVYRRLAERLEQASEDTDQPPPA